MPKVRRFRENACVFTGSILYSVSYLINGLTNQYLLMTDLPLSPGCSGSPIVDDNNRVVGMNAFKSTDFGTEALSFAIYSDKLLRVLEDFDNRLSFTLKEKVEKIGIEFVVTDRVSKGLIDTTSVPIKSILDDSIFKDSELKAGYEIYMIDSEPILTADDFYEKWKPGCVITYRIDSKSKELLETVI